jgi:hypothetical protein
MLSGMFPTTLAVALSLSLIAVASPAQTPSPCGVMAVGVSVYGGIPTTNKPFSITVQTTHEQKLVDGNAIHGLVVTHEYRDSAGRIRGESSMLCNFAPDGQYRPNVNISVSDPVAHTSMSWQTNGTGIKTARMAHQAEPQAAPAVVVLTDDERKQRAIVQENWRKNNRSEKLGARTIAGVLCDGTRSVRTIPAGQLGNEQPLETTDEIWIARDLGIGMLRIEDDPQNGRTTTEVIDLTQGDPDPSLFAPPPDYKLVEQVTTTKPVAASTAQ